MQHVWCQCQASWAVLPESCTNAFTARFREDESWNGHQNANFETNSKLESRNYHSRTLFIWTFEKRPRMTVLDSYFEFICISMSTLSIISSGTDCIYYTSYEVFSHTHKCTAQNDSLPHTRSLQWRKQLLRLSFCERKQKKGVLRSNIPVTKIFSPNVSKCVRRERAECVRAAASAVGEEERERANCRVCACGDICSRRGREGERGRGKN